MKEIKDRQKEKTITCTGTYAAPRLGLNEQTSQLSSIWDLQIVQEIARTIPFLLLFLGLHEYCLQVLCTSRYRSSMSERRHMDLYLVWSDYQMTDSRLSSMYFSLYFTLLFPICEVRILLCEAS